MTNSFDFARFNGLTSCIPLFWQFLMENAGAFLGFYLVLRLPAIVLSLAVFNLTENKDLQNKMNGYGFTPKRVQEGNTLLANARFMHTTQEDHYDQARRLSVQLIQDSDTALDIFKGHIGIARSAFRKEPHTQQELRIIRLSPSRWPLTQQALDFYNKVPAYMTRLQLYGASPEAFEQNKAAIEALITLQAQKQKKKGDAEHSTQEKNQAIKALRAWYGEFRKLARIAFQDTPQVLETFGIVVPSTRKKRQATTTPLQHPNHGSSLILHPNC